MKFQGALRKDGRVWLADVPVFDAMTQGRTRKEALAMIADWFVTVIDRKGFRVMVQPTGVDGFEVGASDARVMIALLLRRQRERTGLSIADVAKRLGFKSANAYARYEHGIAVPTLERHSMRCCRSLHRGAISCCGRARREGHAALVAAATRLKELHVAFSCATGLGKNADGHSRRRPLPSLRRRSILTLPDRHRDRVVSARRDRRRCLSRPTAVRGADAAACVSRLRSSGNPAA